MEHVYIMWQFLCGFGAGVYVGTVYDCKPTLQFVKNCIKILIDFYRFVDDSGSPNHPEIVQK